MDMHQTNVASHHLIRAGRRRIILKIWTTHSSYDIGSRIMREKRGPVSGHVQRDDPLLQIQESVV